MLFISTVLINAENRDTQCQPSTQQESCPLKKSPCTAPCSQSLPPLLTPENSDLFFISVVLTFPECPINRILYVAFISSAEVSMGVLISLQDPNFSSSG